MDRREAARWQIFQARRDVILQCLAALVAVAALLALFACATAAHAGSLQWTQADCSRLLSVINDPDTPPRIKAMIAGKMSELKCPVRPWL